MTDHGIKIGRCYAACERCGKPLHYGDCAMTDPIGTAQDLIERLRREDHMPTFTDSVRWALVNPDGPEAADALQSRIAEVDQFCAIIDKTDDEGFSPEIEQELMDLRAALSLQRRV